jgi:toxin ParE1/3/4
MSDLRVRPEAELDAFEAALWYEREREGLGGAFLRALRRVLARVEASPLQFALVTSDVRRAILARFPFGVFFFVDGDTIVVIAVMHLHRHPSSWARRR